MGSFWRVDETYVRTCPKTGYLYRAKAAAQDHAGWAQAELLGAAPAPSKRSAVDIRLGPQLSVPIRIGSAELLIAEEAMGESFVVSLGVLIPRQLCRHPVMHQILLGSPIRVLGLCHG